MSWMNLHSNIMDAYFLRRFLDKDSITNAVAYTGIYHSINYIFFLVKYSNFKITHCSYINGDISTISQKIKNSKNSIDIHNIFYPSKFIQCTNLSEFPDLFE